VKNFFFFRFVTVKGSRRFYFEISLHYLRWSSLQNKNNSFKITYRFMFLLTFKNKRKKILSSPAFFNYHFRLLMFEYNMFVWCRHVRAQNVCYNRYSKSPPFLLNTPPVLPVRLNTHPTARGGEHSDLRGGR
jgi:hypothetical protein